MEPIYAVIFEWVSLAVRWLHIVTGIAWIGSSFYFIALDLGLKHRPGLAEGVTGEAWQVHGGGFYHLQKYMVAPASMPEHLTWFKWESYMTWISGFVMLCIVYYHGAELFLIDNSVAELSPLTATAIGVAGLALGWILYDLLCRSPLGNNAVVLFIIVFAYLILMSWGFTQVFSGRGAFIHSGAVIATIMTANVFFIIIPNQKKVVAALKAGEEPAAILGKQAKQRSTHNNYFTLPVLFLMLSNHYPLTFGTQWNWLIIALVLVMGVTIRHFFNTMHATEKKLWWTWGVTALCFAAIIWLSTFRPEFADEDASAPADTSPVVASFDDVRDIIISRCSMCHAAEPGWDGITTAPKGIELEEDDDIRRYAGLIYHQSVRSNAMPPGNITDLEPGERRQLAAWFENRTK